MTVQAIQGQAGLSSFLKSAKAQPAVVQFHATWCGPCKAMAPVMDSLASKYAGKAQFAKIDIDESKDVAAAFRVSAVPYFIIFHKENKLSEVRGANPAALEAAVAEAVKKFNVFVGGAGYSLTGGSSSSPAPAAAAAAPAAAGGAGGTAGRRLPWSDPSFVPPYMKKMLEEEKKAEVAKPAAAAAPSPAKDKSAAPKTPWSDPSFKPPAAAVETAPAAAVPAPAAVSSAPAPSSDSDDPELALALALSKEAAAAGGAPVEEPKNDPRLKVDATLLSQLLEFGFTKLRAEKALILTKNSTLENAVNWLAEHGEDPDIDEPLKIVDAGTASVEKVRGAPLGYKPGEVYEDDDDGDVLKKLKKEKSKEKEALKKAIGDEKPLAEMTEEEKLQRFEKLKAARKEQRTAAEALSAKIREKEKRKQIKELADMKKKREEEELARAARARKREKEADKERRQRILDKIAENKEKKAAKLAPAPGADAAPASTDEGASGPM